ncbi:MAG: hypothetical protein KGL35_27405 [Bradyrhizobium sp.]|nr:hypothetical protein [Bradyrhizobium sp.]
MRYFRDGDTVYGYHPSEQSHLVAKALASGWDEITGAWPPPPMPPAIAAQALRDGLHVSFAGHPELSATYGVSGDLLIMLVSASLYVARHGCFPGPDPASFAFPDMDGTLHVFPSVALFERLHSAVADYGSALHFFSSKEGGEPPPAIVAVE